MVRVAYCLSLPVLLMVLSCLVQQSTDLLVEYHTNGGGSGLWHVTGDRR